jgi:hypothetical protein
MDDRERQLEREEAQRRPVAIAGIVTGLLLFAGALVLTTVIGPKDPTVGLVQGLAPGLHGQVRAAVDPHTAHLFFVNHHAASVIAATTVYGIGVAGTLVLLRYLYYAARLRRPETTMVALVFGTAGPLLAGLFGIVAEVSEVIGAHHYVTHAARSHHAVEQATNSPVHVVAISLAQAGQLALAVAFIMISLNAMRVGLLSRFLGIIGAIAGALLIIPVLPLQILPTFWLLGVGVFLSGWAANELPPAWASGEARPWPTQQELREQRQGPQRGGAKVAAKTPAPAPSVPVKPSPSASKKRKRRRR